MKIALAGCILISLSLAALGQQKHISIPLHRDGDTTFWYTWHSGNARKMGLVDLTASQKVFYWRFWTETEAVEIWTDDQNTFQGKLSVFTTRSIVGTNEKKDPLQGKFYFTSNPISSEKAGRIHTLIQTLGVLSIPTEDSISDWQAGLDGITYIVETSTPTTYSFKTYWTPEVYKESVREAAVIDTLAKQLNTLASMGVHFSKFVRTLPPGCYHAGGMMLWCSELNKRRTRRKR